MMPITIRNTEMPLVILCPMNPSSEALRALVIKHLFCSIVFSVPWREGCKAWYYHQHFGTQYRFISIGTWRCSFYEHLAIPISLTFILLFSFYIFVTKWIVFFKVDKTLLKLVNSTWKLTVTVHCKDKKDRKKESQREIKKQRK